MNARSLMVLFDSIYVLALACWVGSIAFFSFGVAPILFKVLGKEAGERFVRAFFPRYYLWGAISGAIALPCAVAVPLCFPELRGPSVGLHALVILSATLVMLYSGNVLTPAINAARDEGEAGDKRFGQLHQRSVHLNLLVLLIGAGLLIAFAARTRPNGAGIVEPTPAERASSEASKILRDRPEAGLPDDPPSTSPRR